MYIIRNEKNLYFRGRKWFLKISLKRVKKFVKFKICLKKFVWVRFVIYNIKNRENFVKVKEFLFFCLWMIF